MLYGPKIDSSAMIDFKRFFPEQWTLHDPLDWSFTIDCSNIIVKNPSISLDFKMVFTGSGVVHVTHKHINRIYDHKNDSYSFTYWLESTFNM